MVNIDQRNLGTIENQPIPPAGGIENAAPAVVKETTRRNLEILLGDKNLDPERAASIRKQIADIDSGIVSPIPEGLGSESLGLATSNNEIVEAPNGLSAKVLAGALAGDIDLIKASKIGAGYDAMEELIEQAKRRAQNN